jgi:hypothetical protein
MLLVPVNKLLAILAKQVLINALLFERGAHFGHFTQDYQPVLFIIKLSIEKLRDYM